MKPSNLFAFGMLCCCIATTTAYAGDIALGTTFTYQGKLTDTATGDPVTSTADFEFRIYDDPVAGNLIGSVMTSLNVDLADDGTFTVDLVPDGGTFAGAERWIRVDVRVPAGGGAYSTLTPRQPLYPAPYAHFALNMPASWVDKGTGDIAYMDGNLGIGVSPPTKTLDVGGEIRARDTIVSDLNGGAPLLLAQHDNSSADKRMWIGHSEGAPNWGIQYRDFASDGFGHDVIEFVAGNQTRPRFGFALSAGVLSLYDGTGSSSTNSVEMDATSSGGIIEVRNTAGLTTGMLDGSSSASFDGGVLELSNRSGVTTIDLKADGGGLGGGETPGISLTHGDGSNRGAVFLQVQDTGGGLIRAFNNSGVSRVELDGDSSGGGLISVRDNDGTETVEIVGAEGSTQGGQIRLFDAAGNETIEIDGDYLGDGRIITQELEITGGSDLSEQFDVSDAVGTPQPGMVVCIDHENPGKLIVSTRAYDRTVAGIISGANGLETGLYMGQRGSEHADGAYPVALTGRVYVNCVSSNGSIQPGDLLTTSNVPGHAMKVTDFTRAHGTIIGKAMTALDEETGHVLVLVSLQ